MNMTAAHAFIFLIGLSVFAYIFYGPWQEACTDFARQIMFERRDALFDLAAKGKLEFSSPQYQALRESMEGMIRFAHTLTLIRFLIFYLWGLTRGPVDSVGPTTKIIDSISDPSVREEVRLLWLETMTAMLAMLGLKSLIFAPLAFIACIGAVCSKGFKFLVRNSRLVKNLSETIESEGRYA